MMKRLWVRLSAAFLLTAWMGIGAMTLVVQRTLDSGFRQYVSQRDNTISSEQAERLEDYFAANGSWAGAESVFGGRGGGGGGAGRGATFSVAELDGMIAASSDSSLVGTRLSEDGLARATVLTVNGRAVGRVYRQSPGVEALGAAETAFLDEANRWLTAAGLGATALALLVGVWLAWTLARPLQTLTAAVRDLSTGQLGRQVQTQGSVEIETLAEAFNSMSSALATGETLRQRMAADVAHELRTPVSVLRGHLEAMLDGVYPMDSAHVAVAHDQTIHLARLVEDLRVLTLAEAKRLPLERTALNAAALIAQAVEAFEPLVIESDIRLKQDVAAALPTVYADVTRVRQVISNLLTNALRHTPAGCEIVITVKAVDGELRFGVANTGSSLSRAEVEHIFQPFWRASAARERDSGGSGLGLAISREIIALHGGRMWVESEAGRVQFYFTLPIAAPIHAPGRSNGGAEENRLQ